MKNDIIVQFVCFVTNLDFEEFVVKWEYYAKRFMNTDAEIILQQQADTKGRFKYVSQHAWPFGDFQFTFMNKRQSEYFPEHTVKVVQAGGYMPLQVECKHSHENGTFKIMAFISHDETDIIFYKELSLYRYLNIYQAYYESCAYAYVLEFFVEESNTADFMRQMKARTKTEVALYKECLMPHV